MHHVYGTNRSYFITFRLEDSLPQSKLLELKNEYKKCIELIKENDIVKRKLLIDEIAIMILGKYNAQLDHNPYGSCILQDDTIAQILCNQILKYHMKLYELKCFSIMPNHVHIILKSLGNTDEDKLDPVGKWLKYIKGGSARLINQALNKSGTIWAIESWDRMIRNEDHYHNAFYYTVNNPEKAGLDIKFTMLPFMWRCDRDNNYSITLENSF